jgi:hypothetical protein
VPIAGFILAKRHVQDADGAKHPVKSPVSVDKRMWRLQIEHATPRWVLTSIRVACVVWLVSTIAIPALWLVVVAFAKINSPGTLKSIFIVWFATPVVLLASAFLVVGLRARFGARAVATACRNMGVCAACGYDIGSLAPGPDGRVVCPECGVAWRSTVD